MHRASRLLAVLFCAQLVALAPSKSRAGGRAEVHQLPRAVRRALPKLRSAARRLNRDLVRAQKKPVAVTNAGGERALEDVTKLERGMLVSELHGGRAAATTKRPVFGFQVKVLEDGRMTLSKKQGDRQVTHELDSKGRVERTEVHHPDRALTEVFKGGELVRTKVHRLYRDGLHVTHIVEGERLVSSYVYDPITGEGKNYAPDKLVAEARGKFTATQLYEQRERLSLPLQREMQREEIRDTRFDPRGGREAEQAPFGIEAFRALADIEALPGGNTSKAAEKALGLAKKDGRWDLVLRLAALHSEDLKYGERSTVDVQGAAENGLVAMGGAKVLLETMESENAKLEELSPGQRQARARALALAGRHADALKMIGEAETRQGKRNDQHTLALLRRNLGEFEAAKKHNDKTIALGPETHLTPDKQAYLLRRDIEADRAEFRRLHDRERVKLQGFDAIGGLGHVVDQIRQLVELPLENPEAFTHIGQKPPGGILLTGPPGVGKTLIARTVAESVGAKFYSINAAEVFDKYQGEAERKLRELFEEAKKNEPSIIFIDELDGLAAKRGENGSNEAKVLTQLLGLLDGKEDRGQVLVMAATNRPEALDDAVRRPGRFDREIALSAPDQKGRAEILDIHTKNMPLAKDVDLAALAAKTHGYTGADLALLAQEAALHAVGRRLEGEQPGRRRAPKDMGRQMALTRVEGADFEAAMSKIKPSALREGAVEVPTVKFEHIGGYDGVKQVLKERVLLPLLSPEMFARLKIDTPKGVLLYGPPGTGKTMFAKALATEAGVNFITVKGSDLRNKYVGESEKAIAKLFDKARQVSPAIIFIDELDSIAPRRGSGSNDSGVSNNMVNELLAQLDGVAELKDVIVVAATNRREAVDPALLRGGRIEAHVEVPLPDAKARAAIFEVMPQRTTWQDVDVAKLAKASEGLSGGDIRAVSTQAALYALRDNKDAEHVSMKHLLAAIEKVRSQKGVGQIKRNPIGFQPPSRDE